ncbi:NAD dependent epimerase/dehydratase family [Legionella oakridgensis ATCC 33761 = DSM 21215]|uniref:NAD dependent epimerase/dehydratase family n=1 Tax=Legionella oakridgensis ATCC 33761 = DSM 21215 TaxID=1268635 RepID=W0BG82_9GAMM|nr:NAD dependent epimerase/dehydratase family [Legionella oakridgensis ATCC 33761 = DSM 21215]
MQLLITGSAGFIGYHLAQKRLQQGDVVIGVDNLNDYYDVRLKLARLEQLQRHKNFIFYKANISDAKEVDKIFSNHQPQRVVNLAAQAGVRYSLKNPHAYIQSNLVGFTNVIEACRHHQVEHLVYASTSSVYGANSKQPYAESDGTNHPLAIYAATKKANELIAHSYSHLYRLPTTGLRFFTVYGPWGRPDMAFFSLLAIFSQAIPLKFTIMATCSEILLILMILWLAFPWLLIILQLPIRPGQLRRQTPQPVMHLIEFITSVMDIR